MSASKDPALQLISDLWADLGNPDFIWQACALLACLGLAMLIARGWRRRFEEGAGRISDAGARLAFPLSGVHGAGSQRCFCFAPGFSQGGLVDRLGADYCRGGLGLAGLVYHRPCALCD